MKTQPETIVKYILPNVTNQNWPYIYITIKIEDKTYTLNLMQSITGCGMGILASFTSGLNVDSLRLPTALPALKEIIKEYCRQKSIYLLMATLGDTYKSFEPFIIEDLKGEMVKEYDNKNHGRGYKQRVYMIEVEKI